MKKQKRKMKFPRNIFKEKEMQSGRNYEDKHERSVKLQKCRETCSQMECNL